MIEPSFGDYVGVAFLCLVAIVIGLVGAASLIEIWKIVASIMREIRAERQKRARP